MAAIATVALILNLPFGYLRSGTKKFSPAWFLYIHAPIPFIIALRMLAGLGYGAVPFIVAGALIGQFTGGLLKRKKVF
ncbi:MAG: hypothetical protein HY890_03255 [Deltaproteobacteria bacterium]|nr:hypothetical protein [Deltaproteobacteria bacterium]